jgi:hypothetical protein
VQDDTGIRSVVTNQLKFCDTPSKLVRRFDFSRCPGITDRYYRCGIIGAAF